MNNILDNINCNIVIVTKQRTIKEIEHYYLKGYNTFGENKVQELLTKVDYFKDANWHFIGRIQSNKIKQIVKYSTLIHSVSEQKHLALIDFCAKKINKIQDILIQINLTNEEQKAGVTPNNFDDFYKLACQYSNINVIGIMVIGNYKDPSLIEETFKTAHMIKEKYHLKELSMGMSNDYKLALKNGSTMLRLGSILFKD